MKNIALQQITDNQHTKEYSMWTHDTEISIILILNFFIAVVAFIAVIYLYILLVKY